MKNNQLNFNAILVKIILILCLFLLLYVSYKLITNEPIFATEKAELVFIKMERYERNMDGISTIISFKGKIQNIGTKDAKNITIGVECPDCVQSDAEFGTLNDLEKRNAWILAEGEQILYLPIDGKEDFDVPAVLNISSQAPELPHMELKILSFSEAD